MKFQPFIPWIGGKSRLANTILPLYPTHTCYVEPFAGAAALLFLKEPSKVEVINDINGDLVNLYRVVQHHLEEFVRQFKWALSSRQVFEWLKDTNPATLTDIQRAARFYYLQKLAFGGKVEGQNFGTATTSPPGLNLLRIEEELSQAHLRLSNVFVENLSWEACIAKYDRPHTLFFCDPPYWGTEGYGVEFGLEQYHRMAELARTIQGKMLITVNDCPEMREAYAGLPMDVVGIKYSVGNLHGNSRQTGELIIRSSEEGFGGEFKPTLNTSGIYTFVYCLTLSNALLCMHGRAQIPIRRPCKNGLSKVQIRLEQAPRTGVLRKKNDAHLVHGQLIFPFCKFKFRNFPQRYQGVIANSCADFRKFTCALQTPARRLMPE